MDFSLEAILPIAGIAVVVILVIILLVASIKVVPSNQVLVITGVGATKNGRPKIKPAGAAFVIPFIQRADKFKLDVQKTGQQSDLVKTKTGVEVVIDWVISYAPNTETTEALLPAVRQFMGKSPAEIENLISSIVAGGVRAVVSTMTPIEVMVGKETLDDAVRKQIQDHMDDLGYVVQLYIQEVHDAPDSSYFHDVAAKDREDTRRSAANITADNERSIREKRAEANKAATDAELKSEVEIAEKTRDTAVRKAAFKVETDRAEADAAIAGELRTAERKKELATNEGQVEVERQQQANYAAQKEREVRITKAETARQEKEIEANAVATVAKTEAEGEAIAQKTRAEGNARQIELEGSANANVIKMQGSAEAEAIKAKGLAEAEAIKAKGLAEAEAERKLAEARAAEDRVNFEIQKMEIERDTKIAIATNVATVMASVGEKATFYDFSGKANGGEGSDLLTGVLGNIPRLFAEANLTNQAANGEDVTETIQRLVNAAIEPLGVLNKENTVVVKEPLGVLGQNNAVVDEGSHDAPDEEETVTDEESHDVPDEEETVADTDEEEAVSDEESHDVPDEEKAAADEESHYFPDKGDDMRWGRKRHYW